MSATGLSKDDSHSSDAPLFPKGNLLPFTLVTALFFFWAIPNNLNDVLIRQFMKSFEINRFQAGLIQSALARSAEGGGFRFCTSVVFTSVVRSRAMMVTRQG